ncbi:MAG TPA: hypothetical protein VF721_22035 [Pyrinomonadaceae bacterium]|jgi:hypothetical protein
MTEKRKSKSAENPEFDNVKAAFRQILSVPKEKLDELNKKRAKPPAQNKQDCKKG